MTHVLVQDCNKANIKKKQVGGILEPSVWWASQPTAAKALYQKTPPKIHLLKTDMFEYIVFCQLKKLCGLCQGTI